MSTASRFAQTSSSTSSSTVVPSDLLDDKTRIFVNPTGRFVIGGPLGDAGLTGRKIIVDTYGGVARHGGGAFSRQGSDEGGPLRARTWRATSPRTSSRPGWRDASSCRSPTPSAWRSPLSLAVETFGTGMIPDEKIVELIRKHFDMRPAAIIRDLDLRGRIYRQVAAYRSLWARRPRRALGAHRQGRDAAQGGRAGVSSFYMAIQQARAQICALVLIHRACTRFP